MRMTSDEITKIQNKYNFDKADTFEKLKSTYAQMIHDSSVNDSSVKHEYYVMKNQVTPMRFINTDDPRKSKNEMLKIIEKEMKSRGLKYK